VFEILQHTADVRLRVTAASVEELFREAMLGMFAIMGAVRTDGQRSEARLTLDSVDRTDLLIDFLSAVLSRAHIEHAAFNSVSFERLTETTMDAVVAGGQARFEQDVKAVTYHEADVRLVGGQWQTMLVFDI
jgi:protein archease